MKPTTTILIGAPLSGEEARFLHRLHADLQGTESLILANFFAAERQIDFVVVTHTYAAVLELKNFERPIFGDRNGVWTYLNPAGRQIRYSGGNPWHQTLAQKYALNDEMERYSGKDHDIPSPSGRAYYSEFDAFVCIYPQIHPGSRVTAGDHKVGVRSYTEVIEILRSGSKPSSWSMSEWKGFAEKHLNLTPTTVEGATNPRIREAHEKILAYRVRIETVIGTALPPLFIGNPNFGQGLIKRLSEPENFVIIGPSGSTKTFHLHHLTLAMSAKDEELPVLIEAKRYRGGDFWTVLKHGTAPLFRGDPKELLEAIRACGLRPVLIIDALNECSASHLPELIRGAQAFALQYEARVVLTSQTEVDLPGDLHSTTIPLALPDLIHKRCIYAYHARLVATPDVDVFCAGFTNAYDLAVAGLCHNSGMPPESRTELYDRYIRRCLSEHTAVSSALLRTIAGEMAKAISTVWSRDMFERAAERFLIEQNASLEMLDELRCCRLIELTDDTFSFEHELLFDYFKAESLRRQVSKTGC